jgi:hypothetical protein
MFNSEEIRGCWAGEARHLFSSFTGVSIDPTPPLRRGERFQVKYLHPLYGATTVHRKLVFLLFPLMLLTACALRGSATPTSEVSTSTPVPTASPTPASKPLTILVLPANMPQADSDQYQKLVYDLTQANGMRFQARNVLTPADVAFEGPALKIVVALPPDPGLAVLTAAAPGVQFLAVGIPGLAAASNLSSIGASGLPVDQQAFLAGYIAGIVAPEWRVGILSQKDTPGGDAAVTAFGNGYHFYCGDCFNPNFPGPNSHNLYPIIVRIPTDAPASDYNSWADYLIRNLVNVAYVYPDIATPDLLSYMSQNGVLLISQTLPGEDVRPNWIASIQPDLISALQGIFPDLVSGKGGQVAPTPLSLTDVNPGLLSDAKMRLVQDVLNGLQDGTIGTGVNP